MTTDNVDARSLSAWGAARLQRGRIAAWALVAAGALVLLFGYLGVARAVYPAQQLPYLISGGLGGLCLVGMGAVVWLSSDLHDEWTKLDLIEEALRELVAEGAPEAVDVTDMAAAPLPAESTNGHHESNGARRSRRLPQAAGRAAP